MAKKRSKPKYSRPKQITPQGTTGQKGVNLVERIVLDMKYAWRPTPIFDVGIDGEIEICDPVTGEATNALIKVQVKSTAQPFTAESSASFEYLCEQKDLDYWLRGNAPVILIVCRPDSNEAYWMSVKEYFKDPATLQTRKIHFDKHRNRFEASSASELKHLALPKDSGVYFAPLPKTEKLYSNLLEVASFAPKIYLAVTDYRERKEVWEKFKAMNVKAGPEWILTNKLILSFHNLENFPFNEVCDAGAMEIHDTSDWADSEDEDKKRDFVKLLNSCLREKSWHLGLRFYGAISHPYYYFRASYKLKTLSIEYQSLAVRTKREVFKQYGKKSDLTQRAYCRHSGFRGYFVRLENKWYLEITPTYHFTSNGYDEAVFRAELVKGIKRLERNPAVIGQLLMWADYLKRPILLPGKALVSEYPFLSFGELATVELDISLPDDVWYMGEEGGTAEAMTETDNQPALFGLGL